MVGYSDATVRLWDLRYSAKETRKIKLLEDADMPKGKHMLSRCFTGSFKMNYFATDVKGNLLIREIESE